MGAMAVLLDKRSPGSTAVWTAMVSLQLPSKPLKMLSFGGLCHCYYPTHPAPLFGSFFTVFETWFRHLPHNYTVQCSLE